VIAETALGHVMPPRAQVHHVDEDKQNNRHDNLVICEDHAYHALLHVRTRVVKAGGDPDTQRICSVCKAVKNLSEFGRDRTSQDGRGRRCQLCNVRRLAKRRAGLGL